MTHTDYLDPVQVRRAYKFLMRPTSKQVVALEACLEDHRQLYNAALEERREAWRMGKIAVGFFAQSAQMPAIRAADRESQGRWSANAQIQTLRRLEHTFSAFRRRVRAGEKTTYPRFKGRGRFDSVTWKDRDGCRWDADPDGPVTRVRLQGIGHVRVHQHRGVRGRVKMVTVKREGTRWYVILSCDDIPAQPLPVTGAAVGIDLGVASFLTSSDGEHVPNPRPLGAVADRLADVQRSLVRKKRGSRRKLEAGQQVAALHRKARRSRLDHAHKTALALIRDHDVICHEALPVANMTRRPKPRPAGNGAWELNGAAAKCALNKSIYDAGWGVFLRVLASKAEEAGRQVIAVNPVNTSRRCTQCGHVAAGNRVSQAVFQCLACGHAAHADVNAAINILRAGLALQAQSA